MGAAKVRAKTARNDPPHRHHDSMTSKWLKLEGMDPKKYYVYVNKEDHDALGEYEAEGYEYELYREGGVRPLAMSPANIKRKGKYDQEIEFRGCALMSIDRKVREATEREGLREQDQLLAKIRSKNVGRGMTRGMTRGRSGEELLSIENETGPQNEAGA